MWFSFRMKSRTLGLAALAGCIALATLGAPTLAFDDNTFSHIVESQTSMVRRQATELQIKVAVRNATAYIAQLPPEKKLELKKKKIRYLAVPTVRSKETSPEAKAVVMIWDIPRETLVNKNVYEVENTPAVGKLASYDNIAAEYVGIKSMTQ